MKRTLLGSAAVIVLTASAASAQSIDYATMQDMFGEPVTLGATGAPQRASEVPATMIIITRDEIDRYPAIDIPDILGRFAGVDIDRYTRGQAEVSIRGYSQPYNPRLLVLDEATEGLAPVIRQEIWSALRLLKAQGQSTLIVDKSLGELLPVADRCTILEKGRTAWTGPPEALDAGVRDRYLGV